jgi:hypothetical protein
MILPVWAGRGGKTALNPSIASLPKEAWYLLWEYAVCKRTYKPRGPGRPTESREKKLGNTGTHRAVRLALDIEDILPGKYPNEQTEWIRERAIELASIISEVPGTRIANYLERPRGDRRRLW